MKSSQRHTFIAAALITALSASASAYADEGQEALAKATQNPIASLISVPLQYNYDQNIGPQRTGNKNHINVQPVIPFSISAEWNLISRTIVPLVTQSDIVPARHAVGPWRHHAKPFLSPKKPTAGGLILGRRAVCYPLRPTTARRRRGPAQLQWLKQESGDLRLAREPYLVGAGTSSRADISSTFLQPFLGHYEVLTTYSVNTESAYNWKGTHRWSCRSTCTLRSCWGRAAALTDPVQAAARKTR
jgi:hypothetical protein